MKAIIIFTHYSLSTPTDNLVECYVNKHIDGLSYRVVVKDASLVDINYYKADAVLDSFVIGQKTIFEGASGDIPHINFRNY